MNKNSLTRKQTIDILYSRMSSGDDAEACARFMMPLLNQIEEDCFEQFIHISENCNQKIDNSEDFMVKSKMKVVREIKEALAAAISLKQDAQEQLKVMEAKR